MDERRKNRRKKSHQRRKEREPVKASDTKPSTEVRGNTDDKAGGNLKPISASVLTHAIRAAGILPIAVLISILVTHHFYGSQIPQCFQPMRTMFPLFRQRSSVSKMNDANVRIYYNTLNKLIMLMA